MVIENQETSIEKHLIEIKARLSIFDNIYTHIRIVQPIEKITYSIMTHEHETKLHSEHCCEFWGVQKDCSNCISMRAFNSNKSTVKVEIKDKSIFLIQAFPIVINCELFVIEMIKDISNDEIVLSSNQEDKNIYDYVKDMNTQLVTDELTGAFNRKYLEEHLPTSLYKARMNNSSVSIVMADIDFFKLVNDNYGHVVGDCVLKKFSELINQSIRSTSDWMVRYGGEEFIIIFSDIDKTKTYQIVENIRKKIEQTEFECLGNKIKITCSFGISIVDNSSYDLSKIIASADKCLYLAKQNGRNQSIII